MATQTGLLKIEGTLGNLTYYKTDKGYFIRKKSTLKRTRVKKDPAFRKSRENCKEFGRASKAGCLLRTALQPLLKNTWDGHVTGRLTREMLKVIQSDTRDKHGQRNAANGDPLLLQGFEFNSEAPLATVLLTPLPAKINPETGQAAISLPQLVPSSDMVIPQGATHFKFVASGAELDFKNTSHSTFFAESRQFSAELKMLNPLTLSGKLTPQSNLPQFLAFGIEFYSNLNGISEPLNNGEFNPLSLVAVNPSASSCTSGIIPPP